MFASESGGYAEGVSSVSRLGRGASGTHLGKLSRAGLSSVSTNAGGAAASGCGDRQDSRGSSL